MLGIWKSIKHETQKSNKEMKRYRKQRLNVPKPNQSSMRRMPSDLAGLLISIGKIVQREESGQSKDFEEGK